MSDYSVGRSGRARRARPRPGALRVRFVGDENEEEGVARSSSKPAAVPAPVRRSSVSSVSSTDSAIWPEAGEDRTGVSSSHGPEKPLLREEQPESVPWYLPPVETVALLRTARPSARPDLVKYWQHVLRLCVDRHGWSRVDVALLIQWWVTHSGLWTGAPQVVSMSLPTWSRKLWEGAKQFQEAPRALRIRSLERWKRVDNSSNGSNGSSSRRPNRPQSSPESVFVAELRRRVQNMCPGRGRKGLPCGWTWYGDVPPVAFAHARSHWCEGCGKPLRIESRFSFDHLKTFLAQECEPTLQRLQAECEERWLRRLGPDAGALSRLAQLVQEEVDWTCMRACCRVLGAPLRIEDPESPGNTSQWEWRKFESTQ